MVDGHDYQEWIGRTVTQEDMVTASPIERLDATLETDHQLYSTGVALPPLAHWLYFLPNERQSTLGPDGHPKRGGFLPPIHDLPRRMWAGSRLTFKSPLRVGMHVKRTSTIESVTSKQGTTGPLVFVTVGHAVHDENGHLLLTDHHDIVYRDVTAPADRARSTAPKGPWHRSIVPDTVMLFRYSALTFNGHRIHYDRTYVFAVEGYPGLIVHGPLIATLLIDLVRRSLPSSVVVKAYSFRAVSPLFDGSELHLNGSPPDETGKILLWATNDRDELIMKAEATI
ncbi:MULTISPECIES: FAS1-like dehydratase domain-containing protein [Bradyrhizobium]|uniref:Acyl-CoA dehydrogenase n=3 Tax=Bradyrhizobium TaxID=374 RepID=A0A410VJ98_9BRAD|nr:MULTISPECIES: MaoC family dehydratase N-terminal domain-containing protein [Bradyrhizobium]MCG2629346.1 MaoC family dehydratase N-terminal domain-containing protein [Bradyrhizobium zhengyangense]MCG2644627.1 MaoC family dehydratase N-terminal domain-containing protein [Bradyrhizobium zhengyangense]MCG2670860.1 MaoC family dehydratase N-terminal domain-containing protein [Bradyrhizobium zhengyangense]MDN4984493.1 MaoC family dehydratase N-terminal domain-containing protein [Bradyrhizobium sp.